MTRLRRSDCSGAGIRRRRRGRGFSFTDPGGKPIRDEETIERLRSLAIPPAWEEVWICPEPNGHIQATGFDDAGRKQYLYHPRWQKRASSRKFDLMIEFSLALGGLRNAVGRDLDLEGMPFERAAACAVRMIDVAHLRIGNEQYADENGTYGVATLLSSHVSLPRDAGVRLDFPGKGSQRVLRTIDDRQVRAVAGTLRRRRTGPEDFLVFRNRRSWSDLTSDDVNRYVRRHSSETFSAKDFRTWNATVLAAAHLASGSAPASKSQVEHRIREALASVAVDLGNTPAVCRSSYVDPRVFDRFRDGDKISLPGGTDGKSPSYEQRLTLEPRVRRLISST